MLTEYQFDQKCAMILIIIKYSFNILFQMNMRMSTLILVRLTESIGSYCRTPGEGVRIWLKFPYNISFLKLHNYITSFGITNSIMLTSLYLRNGSKTRRFTGTDEHADHTQVQI